MVKFDRTDDDSDIIHARKYVTSSLGAWHADRLEWVGHALRSLILVNAGGAVAVAAYIGARPVNAKEAVDLFIALISFSAGLTIMVLYPVYRFGWAEFRVWYLRWKRSRLRKMKENGGQIEFMDKRPPTRWQMLWTYLACIGSLACFIYGLGRSIAGLLVRT